MRQMRRPHFIRYVVAAGVLLVAGLSPFAFGAVHPVFYTAFQVLAFALVVVAVVRSVFSSTRPTYPEFKGICLLAAGFGLLAAFQLLPLGSPLLRLFSPQTVSTIQAAMPWRGEISGSSISLCPLGAQLSVLQYLACFGIFILTIVSFSRRKRRFLLAWSLTATGLVLALVGLYQHWHSPGKIYGFWQSVYGGAPFGPFVNRNHFAGYLEMILPLSAALIFIKRIPGQRRDPDEALRGRRLRWWQILALSCFVLMFIALMTSLSRGGMIATSAAVLVMSAVAWRKARTRRAGLYFAAILVASFVLGCYYAGPELVGRLRELYADLMNPMRNSRAIATCHTLELFGQYPLFGTGLGSFSSVFTSVQSPELGLGLYQYAHNDWAQLMAETGLAGIVIALMLAGALLRLAHRRLRQDKTASGWWLTLGATGSLSALAVHSVFDFNLHIPSNAYLASAVAGLLCVSAVSPRRQRRSAALADAHPRLALASVLCVAIAMGAASIMAITHYLSGSLLEASEVSSLPDADRLALASRLCPRDPRPLHLLSRLYTQLATQQEGDSRERHYLEGIRYGRLAIEQRPTYSPYHERLGWLLYWGGGSQTEQEREAAQHHFQQAVDFDPAYPDWRLSLARFYLRTGRLAEAERYFAEVMVLVPRRTREMIAELDAAGTSVQRLREILPATADAHMALGDYLYGKGEVPESRVSYARACELVSNASVQQKSTAALSLSKSGDVGQAKAYLERWLKEDGEQPEYLRALAEIARKEGDGETRLLYLEKIAQRAPEDVRELSELAAALKSAGEHERALALYQKGYRVDPTSEGLCEAIIECFSKLGQGDEAMKTARDFLLRRPGSARIHSRLGSLLYESNRIVEAFDQFEEAVALDPGNGRYKTELQKAARLLEQLRRIKSSSEGEAEKGSGH